MQRKKTLLGWCNSLNKKSLKKLKIIQVDGMLQHVDHIMLMPMDHG